jgi:hypothetical protein
MNLESVIAQLKTYVPALGGRISGAADFAAGLESVVDLPLPAGFVMPLDDDAGDNDSYPGLYQPVTERIGVVVEFDNTTRSDADARTGFSGADQVYPMRANIFSAVLSWIPTDQVGRAARGFSYGGGRLLTFDRARLFWQFEFTLDTLITDADGFPISGDPLTDVRGTIQPSGDPGLAIPIIFDVINS